MSGSAFGSIVLHVAPRRGLVVHWRPCATATGSDYPLRTTGEIPAADAATRLSVTQAPDGYDVDFLTADKLSVT
jgi:hypothetical protein